MTNLRWLLTIAAALLPATAIAQSPALEPGTTFRVFLSDGQALPAYGEAVRVGDRLVFTLLVGAPIGAGAGPEARGLQLMSLPLDKVDVARTTRYAEAMRAAHYAASRGEADYAAMTAEVQRALDHLATVTDPQQRLALAEEAKRRLLAWSAENYSYRANDIRELGALFDEVITQLRAAAGQSEFSLDLRAGPAAPVLEPLLPNPTHAEAVALALHASRVADVALERAAILEAALASLDDAADAAALRARVAGALEAERAADVAYARLAADARARAAAAMRQGDVAGVSSVRIDVVRRDLELGARRSEEVRALLADINVHLDRARAHRLALDHYALLRRSFLAYERRVRPMLSGLDGLSPVLRKIETEEGMAFERLEGASERLAGLLTTMRAVRPPEDLAGVHATLVSALHLAEQACARRRLAVISKNVTLSREASSAAVGAMLLAAQARQTLVAHLFPPRIE